MRKYSNFTKVKENSVARRTNFMFKTIELIQSCKLYKKYFWMVWNRYVNSKKLKFSIKAIRSMDEKQKIEEKNLNF